MRALTLQAVGSLATFLRKPGDCTMRLLASLPFFKFVTRLLTAPLLVAMLTFAATAKTGAASSAEGDAVIADWGASGSAPQTGSSAHTSGKAFSPVNGSTAPEVPTHSDGSSAAQKPDSAAPPASKILVVIKKATQEMSVFEGDVERHTWKVSTGLPAYDTPSGTYSARSMNEIWYSREWDDAPMPHAIFFTRRGHAIHGTEETNKLGRPASHGCVRLAPENARTLFALVKERGLENTEIVLSGDIPRAVAKTASPKPRKQAAPRVRAKVASPGSRKQQIKAPDKNTGTVLKKDASSNARAASTVTRKQPRKEVFDPKSDAREFEQSRRLTRRERLRLYYQATPRAVSPPGHYELKRRRLFRRN
jgi:lipoprotein-anchoring transpeptidase ErfK/SrfK